jgi:hypothetical protein
MQVKQEQEEPYKESMEEELMEQVKRREVLLRILILIPQEVLDKEEMVVEEERDIMVQEVHSV